jgi:hypothetical protein
MARPGDGPASMKQMCFWQIMRPSLPLQPNFENSVFDLHKSLEVNNKRGLKQHTVK